MIKSLILVDIFYYNPDYQHIIQEFIFETYDVPGYPRVHRFLCYWKDNIEAKINQIYIASSNTKEFKCANYLLHY